MFTLNRGSVSTVALATGLVLLGCASPTEETTERSAPLGSDQAALREQSSTAQPTSARHTTPNTSSVKQRQFYEPCIDELGEREIEEREIDEPGVYDGGPAGYGEPGVYGGGPGGYGEPGVYGGG